MIIISSNFTKKILFCIKFLIRFLNNNKKKYVTYFFAEKKTQPETLNIELSRQ